MTLSDQSERNRIRCREYYNGHKQQHCERVRRYKAKRRADPRLRLLDAACHRQYLLLTKYGISESEYQTLYKRQKGQCLICLRFFAKLTVDHDHQTGAVRGLLCSTCNRVLGYAERHPKILTEIPRYLSQSRVATVLATSEHGPF
jgi:hypothetical protein